MSQAKTAMNSDAKFNNEFAFSEPQFNVTKPDSTTSHFAAEVVVEYMDKYYAKETLGTPEKSLLLAATYQYAYQDGKWKLKDQKVVLTSIGKTMKAEWDDSPRRNSNDLKSTRKFLALTSLAMRDGPCAKFFDPHELSKSDTPAE